MRMALAALILALGWPTPGAAQPGGDMPFWQPKRELPQLFRQAREVAPEKAKDLEKLESEWVPKWMRQHTEVRIAELAVDRTLRDPDASEKDLSQALDRLNGERAKLHEIEKQALLALRRTLGGEAFARLMSEPPFMIRFRGMGHRFFPHVEDIEMEIQKVLEGMKEAAPEE